MSHTPGPWRSSNVGGKGYGKSFLVLTYKGRAFEGDQLKPGGISIAEARANARLAAAAPDLLEALHAVADLLNTASYNKFGKPMWLSIEATAAREAVRLLALRYDVAKAGSVCEQAGNVARAAIAKAEGK